MNDMVPKYKKAEPRVCPGQSIQWHPAGIRKEIA
jgi:hypothetical protein